MIPQAPLRVAASVLLLAAAAKCWLPSAAAPAAPRHLAARLARQRLPVVALSAAQGGAPEPADPNDEADSLPISFRSDNGTRDSEWTLEPRKGKDGDVVPFGEDNPYFQFVASLTPNEIIGRFAATAPPRVQEAVRTTILGLLGSMSKYATETATVTTAERLANLMFQLQMTGYMFKNAEYRMSLSKSLQEVRALTGDAAAAPLPPPPAALDPEAAAAAAAAANSKVKGVVTITMSGGQQVEVDADAYMAELRDEVETLRTSLSKIEEAKAAQRQKDMLGYIRALPEEQMRGLSESVSPDVLDAMKKLVSAVMKGMGASEVSAETLTSQSGAALSQLCMWQLVVGFNLRELEVRNELQARLQLEADPDADAAEAGSE